MDMAPKYDPKDPTSIERFAKRLIRKNLGEVLDPLDIRALSGIRNVRYRGSFGDALERYYFRISPDNRSGLPDFEQAGVELKSTPMKRKGSRFVAKERMVLTMIDYMGIPDEAFRSSAFMKKNSLILAIFYLHEEGKAIVDYQIKVVGLWAFPEDDLEIIKRDWENIRSKVISGKADEISERDTVYLGACTKGKDAKTNWRGQPFSERRAKGRAFSLKASYVTSMIEAMVSRGDSEPVENKVVKEIGDLRDRSLEELVIERFEPYLGKDIGQLSKELGIVAKKEAKNYNDLLTRSILKVKDRMIEFEKADIAVKSIVLETSGKLRENISFPAFDYSQLVKERDWESSSIKAMFDRKFFFVIYQKTPGGGRVLRRVMFWAIPTRDMAQVKKVWSKAREMIAKGRYDDLPKITDNPVSHIRPHGRNALDVVSTPDGGTAMRRCFWLNASYIVQQVNGRPWSDYDEPKKENWESGAFVQRTIDLYE